VQLRKQFTREPLAVLAILCLGVGAWVILANRHQISVGLGLLSGLTLLGCIAGGIVTEVFHIKTTSIGDARLAFVCLTALGVVLVIGSVRIFSGTHSRLAPVGLFFWPIIFLALDLYVLTHFLIPLGGL
jgi:hypothetical protein